MRIGSQIPRVEYIPPGAVETLADDPILLWNVCGLELDPWQEYILQQACALGEDGKWSAFEVGLEAPRQNGKTGAVEALLLAALFMWDTQEIIYSAHEFKTTVKTFRRLERIIRSTPSLMAEVARIRYGNDNKSIELHDGTVLNFVARGSGSGRGFSADLVILDEAYNLSTDMMAATLPAMAARSIDGNPQIWYLSSAGKAGSEVLNGVRKRATEGKEESLLWLEWSSPKGTDPDDVEAWYQANPALGIRISEKYVRSELASFRSDPDLGEIAWMRERLGIREGLGDETFFDMDSWALARDPLARPSEVLAFAIDVPPSRDVANIGMVSLLPNGDVMVELVDREAGTAWVPKRMKELQARHKPQATILDARSAAAALESDLRGHGVNFRFVSTSDYTAAAGQIFDMVHPQIEEPDEDRPRLVHIGQEELTNAVEAAKPRYLGEGSAFLWNRKNVTHDISPLVAVTLALAGLQRARRKQQRANRGAAQRRKVVVMG